MDINRIVAELQAERERVDVAINAMELLVLDGKKKRGRPKKTTLTVMKQIDVKSVKPKAKAKKVKVKKAKKAPADTFVNTSEMPLAV